MIINSATLNGLRTSFSTLFQGRLGQTPDHYRSVSTTVLSTSRSNTYAGLKSISGMREWIGPRQVDSLSEFDYEIVNKSFEKTISVNRDDIDDDNLGQYSLGIEMMADAAAAHPNELVFKALKNGFSTNCFDGQYYFDTDHPVIGDDGETVGTYANTDGGSGTPWFLLCSRALMKPIIYQERKKTEFVAKDNPDDERVFMNKEFVYGADNRCNVGYGFPQVCWGSKQTLNATNYATARAALAGMKGDGGRPLGLMPDLLVFPPSLESAARKLIKSENASGGETNEWKDSAELLMVQWLA